MECDNPNDPNFKGCTTLPLGPKMKAKAWSIFALVNRSRHDNCNKMYLELEHALMNDNIRWWKGDYYTPDGKKIEGETHMSGRMQIHVPGRQFTEDSWNAAVSFLHEAHHRRYARIGDLQGGNEETDAEYWAFECTKWGVAE